jgi:hypothetical protein
LEALVPEELKQDYRTTLVTVCNELGYRWDSCRVRQMEHKSRKLKTKYHDLKETKKTIAHSPKAKPEPGGRIHLDSKQNFHRN